MFVLIITQKSKLVQSLTLHNVAIPIKSVFKKYQNDYDYKIYFLVQRKNPTKICDVDVNNIVISKLTESKNISMYLIVLVLFLVLLVLILCISFNIAQNEWIS